MSNEPGLVPELVVTDYEASRRFWCDLVGFSLRYERPEEGFGYLVLGNAHLMLDQIDHGRTWATGPLEFPLGRGINFEVQVDNLDGTLQRITEAGWPIFVEPEEKWYRAGDVEIGVRQFLIQDPDGYLVRLQQEIGERPTSKTHADCTQDVRSSD
ncbi:bleomycin resistance protein [Actinomyces sp.]